MRRLPPWLLVRRAVLAWLRHNQTDYNERLRTRYEYDKDFRDELAAQVAAAAFRKYPWLRDDPRPFPESKRILRFDGISKDLADLHTLRDQLISAIRDLKRQGNHRGQIAALQATLEETQSGIDQYYDFLSAPKCLPEEGKTRSFVCVHPKQEGVEPHYHFYSGKAVTPNRIEYLGFCCPRCDVSVARWKQIVPFGQGYWCVIYACHCITCAVYLPAGFRVEPVTAEHWERFCQQTGDKYFESKEK